MTKKLKYELFGPFSEAFRFGESPGRSVTSLTEARYMVEDELKELARTYRTEDMTWDLYTRCNCEEHSDDCYGSSYPDAQIKVGPRGGIRRERV